MYRSVFIGIVSGVVAAFIWALLEKCKRWCRNRKNFGNLTGQYNVFRKFHDQPDESVRLRVSGNIVTVDYEKLPNDDEIHGEIAMSESFPNCGEGYYFHKKDGVPLWGFWKIQVKDVNNIFVHTTYAHKEHSLITQGYLWKRIIS